MSKLESLVVLLPLFFLSIWLIIITPTLAATDNSRGHKLTEEAEMNSLRYKELESANPSQELSNSIVYSSILSDTSLQSAESSSNFKKTDIIMVTTLDGLIYGVDRITGAVIWTQKNIWGPPVHTKGMRAQRKQTSTDNSESNKIQDENNERDEKQNIKDFYEDGIYIPEPVGDGNLYHYIPGQAIKVGLSQYLML